MTALPNPFLSASDGLHPLSSVAVTLGAGPTALESVTAEILSSDGRRQSLADGSFLSGSTLGLPDSSDPAGSLVPAPQAPAGTIPLDYETILKALESCLHEDWIFGIDEPDPLVFLETFKLGEVA